MNRGALAGIKAIDPDAVVVKGVLTSMGTRAEYQMFLNAYGPAFGERLVHVRGNHGPSHGEDFPSHAPLLVNLPGVTLAVIDTSIPGKASGGVSASTLEWLDQV